MNGNDILRRLDDPWKLGIWELDVAIPALLCLFGGLMRGTGLSLFMGAFVGFLVARQIGKIKAARHPRYFRHLMYWTLPSAFQRRDTSLPPASQQEMVG